MPFIGNQPAESYSAFQKQDFSTSATTSYTLDHPVSNQNEIALFINFVRQEPTTAYTASGTSLTLTSATSSSDDMYCVYLGKAVQTVNPPNGSVGLSQLSATGTKDSTTFLRGDNTFASAGGTNTPSFYVFKNAEQTVSNDVDTLVSFQTEVIDTDNCFDNSSTYRFQPTTAGKYFIFASLSWETGNNLGRDVALRFNRSGTFLGYVGGWTNYTSYAFNGQTLYASTIQSFNGTTDYISCYGRLVANTTLKIDGGYPDANGQSTVFGGYKLIT